MTAKINIKKEREGERMNVKKDDHSSGIPPAEPDEGWWAAVLADEPRIETGSAGGTIMERADSFANDDGTGKASSSSVNWQRVKDLFINDSIVEMIVVGHNRGGVLVAEEDIHGFVPASHLIDIPPEASEEVREKYLTGYLAQKISLKVIECEPEKERVVFSERAAQAKEGQRKRLLHSLNEGDVVSGIVTNVTSFGAFVDLGGLEGLIHVSELSWGRVQHPSEIVSVNDEVETIVLQVSEDQCRIALSMKRLQENPWETLAEKLSPGAIVNAVITHIVKYGAFARLPEGVEGLIHISSMNFPAGCKHIDDFLYEDQLVQVCILNIDANKRRLGLKLESY